MCLAPWELLCIKTFLILPTAHPTPLPVSVPYVRVPAGEHLLFIIIVRLA